jgi:hypothetical protein
VISGCVTSVVSPAPPGAIAPSHGSLSVSGNTLLYTPNGTYTGSDTFMYQARGVNTDGAQALSSGNVTVTVVFPPTVPTLGTTGLVVLAGLMVLLGVKALVRYAV